MNKLDVEPQITVNIGFMLSSPILSTLSCRLLRSPPPRPRRDPKRPAELRAEVLG